MILPCQKFCQVTSLGVVPRSRKVLCCSCFWHQRLIFNNKIYNADVNNNVVNIKVLLSVSSVLLPFLTPETWRGKFYKISCFSSMPKKMDHSKRSETSYCYTCGTPPALFWLNPPPSSVNPCVGMLVPKKGMWIGEYDPLKHLEALQGSPSQPQLEVLPPPRKPHSLQSQQWKCNEKTFSRNQTCFCSLLLSPPLAKDLLSHWALRTWLLPVRLSQMAPFTILPISWCSLLCWPSGARCLCHSVTVT